MVTHNESWVGLELSGGRYRIEALLGEGGMGFVYRARDRNLDTVVVIKVPRRALLDDPDFAHRFGREIRALVQLVHPHIVKITDAGEHEGLPYAVMQYLPGGSLEDRRVPGPDGRAQPLPPASLDDWLPVIAKTLDFVHSRAIVHRDVKPGNILFDQSGNAYLSDFGIVKALATASQTNRTATMTSAGNVVGTPEYMALELIMGQPYDGRADQYALAVTVYELLAGRRPFEETGTAVMVRLGQAEGPPELHRVCPSVPEGLSYAIHRGLEKDLTLRYPSCSAFASAVLAEARVVVARGGESTRKMAVDPGTPAAGRVILACPSCGGRVWVPESARGRRGRCSGCQARFRIADDLKSLVPVVETPSGGETTLLHTLGITSTDPPSVDPAATKRGHTAREPAGAKGGVSPPTPPAAVDGPPAPDRTGDGAAPTQRRRALRLGAAVAAGTLGIAALAGALVLRSGGEGEAVPAVGSTRSAVGPGGSGEPTGTKPAGPALPEPSVAAAQTSTIVEPVTLLDIPEQSIEQGRTLTLSVQTRPSRAPGRDLRFRLLAGAPAGTGIDSSSGAFTWTPSPGQRPGSYRIDVEAFDPAHPGQNDQKSFLVHVREMTPPKTAAFPLPSGPDAGGEPVRHGPPATNDDEAPAPSTTAATPPGPRTLIHEDFSDLASGELPEGWDAQFENVAKSRGRGNALELTDPTRRDLLTLPPVELSRDFEMDLALSIPSSSMSVGVQLEGGSRESLSLYVLGDGTVIQSQVTQRQYSDQSGAFRRGATNRLQVERRGLNYRVKVNDVVVSQLPPVRIGKVRFKTIRLSLGPADKAPLPRRGNGDIQLPFGFDAGGGVRAGFRGDDSPRIHLLRLVTLDPGT